MARIEKTVFISYRRTNAPWALAIFQNLYSNGFDVFFDFKGIASGDFESVILGNIRSRAHFIVLLTPSALERCTEPGDWLRREIEEALAQKRNIVPLMLEGFDFGTPTIANQLTGKLAVLKRYNALDVPASYFMEAMQRLREQYLKIALEGVLHPPTPEAKRASKSQQVAADRAPHVAKEELTAQQWFERSFYTKDLDEQIRFYTKAILLSPNYPEAFVNRSFAYYKAGKLEKAIEDADAAIRLKPDLSVAFYIRASARGLEGDLEGATADYSEAIRLTPENAAAFNNRGIVQDERGNVDGALADYSEAIRLKPDYTNAYYNRALIFQDQANYRAAIADFQRYLDLGGGVRDGEQADVEQMIRDLRKKLVASQKKSSSNKAANKKGAKHE